MAKCVAINQPTYLPWIGWFDIMDQADEFVLLDSVQFERHSWQHRNRLRDSRGELVLTVPVRQTGLATPICQALVADRRAVVKHFVTMTQTYARAPYGKALLDALEPLYADVPERLVDLNTGLIRRLADLLDIRTPVVKASDLPVGGRKDVLVRSICDVLGADGYLSGVGSRAYLEAGSAFDDGAVRIHYHEYECLPYRQAGAEFVPFMSAVDVLANTGPSARGVMVGGRRGAPAERP